ncbi:MAG: hypothetical protein OXH96_02015 [Spirochaetaceae bacterium]|nr:hypothetical protein [Spirochaetaceae bacterium]
MPPVVDKPPPTVKRTGLAAQARCTLPHARAPADFAVGWFTGHCNSDA